MHVVAMVCELGIASVTVSLWVTAAQAAARGRTTQPVMEFLFFGASLLTTTISFWLALRHVYAAFHYGQLETAGSERWRALQTFLSVRRPAKVHDAPHGSQLSSHSQTFSHADSLPRKQSPGGEMLMTDSLATAVLSQHDSATSDEGAQ